MTDGSQFYIDGKWVQPVAADVMPVINPATEEPFAEILLAGIDDVNRAVAAARQAFPQYANTSRERRLELLRDLLTVIENHRSKLAEVISREMGAPIRLARGDQTAAGPKHIDATIEALEQFAFEQSTVIAPLHAR